MTPIPASSLSRRYTLLIAVLALPLLALVGVLGAYQYQTQRRLELDALQTGVSETKLVVERVVQDASDHLVQLKALAEDHLSGRIPGGDHQIRSLLADTRPATGAPDGMTLDGIAGGPYETSLGNALVVRERLGSALPGELDMALDLFEPTRLTHLVRPNLRWSYYFSASGAFITMFPFVPRRDLVEGFGHASVAAMIDHYLSYEVYRDVTPARNPGGAPQWTPPYLDAAGAGWMVSHAVPLTRDGRFVGVLGTDLLLSYLDETLARLQLQAGGLWIVDPAGNLVADRAGTPVGGAEPRKLRAALPPALAGSETELAELTAPGRRRVAGHEVIATAVAGTPWTMLYVVSDADLARIAAARIAPYGVVLLGLLMMLVAAHRLLRSQFVRPAIALAEHLQAESCGAVRAAFLATLVRQDHHDLRGEARFHAQARQQRAALSRRGRGADRLRAQDHAGRSLQLRQRRLLPLRAEEPRGTPRSALLRFRRHGPRDARPVSRASFPTRTGCPDRVDRAAPHPARRRRALGIVDRPRILRRGRPHG